MGEYIATQEIVARDLGDEDTERNLEFIKKLRALEISGLIDLPQVSSFVWRSLDEALVGSLSDTF